MAFQITFKPDREGFWYRITSPESAHFFLTFVALGSGGHQVKSEISGYTHPDSDWVYWPVHFQVIHVGAVEFNLDYLSDGSYSPSADNEEESFSPVARAPSSDRAIKDSQLFVPADVPEKESDSSYMATPYYPA